MIKVWPWRVFNNLHKEIDKRDSEKEALQATIDNLNSFVEKQFKENQELKQHIVSASKIVEQKEEDFKRTIAFMKLQDLNK